MEIKGKTIACTPSQEEYDKILEAAEATKRSLASFCLYASLLYADKVKEENAK